MFLTALFVLLTMIALAVWAKGLPKLLCVLIGILLGYGVAGLREGFPQGISTESARSPILALPDPRFLTYSLEPSMVLPLRIAAHAYGLLVGGVLTTCQQ